jgi:hydroxysqualene dehydroxylase
MHRPVLPAESESRTLRCAVVGAGWAGLAAAVRAVQAGHEVRVFEMASAAGGRARTVAQHGRLRDNGQHILIGAYVRTLDLMRTVGVDLNHALARLPLALVDGQGRGLRLPPGPPALSFFRAVLGHSHWRWASKWSLLRHAIGWQIRGFRCAPELTVAQWCAGLADEPRRDLIEPLCVAALNTPAERASAAVLLRVLRDALFSGKGSADLLLPRLLLSELLPQPALAWLKSKGAQVSLGHRVQTLQVGGGGSDGTWLLDGEPFDHVVLACTAKEAARLVLEINAAWAERAGAFTYEPIITAWLKAEDVRAPAPMILLQGEPAQFGFDLGQLDPQRQGELSVVVSGAGVWLEARAGAFEGALEQQLRDQWSAVLPTGWQLIDVSTEKRATFCCIPGLRKPPAAIAPSLYAAGDYVEGPYPATLEAAVRSGEEAISAIQMELSRCKIGAKP